jgi:phosphate-selective porin OprO/OprP
MARHRIVTQSILVSSVLVAAVAIASEAQAQAPNPGAAPPPAAAPAPAPEATPTPAPATAPADAVPAPAPEAVPPPAAATTPPPTAAAPPPAGVIDIGVAPEPTPEAKPKKPADANKLQIVSANGDHKVEFHGLVDADGRFFLTDKGGISTFLVRRARPIVDAKVFKYFELSLQSELASSKFQVLDAYGNVHIWDELQLRVGKGKAPVGLERLQSPRDTFFPEPAFPTLLVPNRDIGAMLHGKIAEGTFEYQVGVFNGVPNGQSGETDTNDSKDVEGRVFLLPFLPTDIDPLKGFGVGIAATTGNEQGPVGPYVTSGQATFFSYGSSVNGLGRRQLVTPQSYYYYGPIGAMFEYVRVRDHFKTPNGVEADVGTQAWALQASGVLGGKQGFKGIKVAQPLDPAKGDFGAFELGARWGDLRVGDSAFNNGFAKRTTSAQRATQWGVAGTWHFADGQHLRVSYERTNFRGGAADGGDKNPELLLLTRLQASF